MTGVVRRVVFAASLVMLSVPASAQHPVYPEKMPALQSCMNGPAGEKPLGRARCTQEEYERQERRMKIALDALQPFLTHWEKEHLGRVQLAWRRWRDLRCSFVDSEPGSGSESRSESSYCLANTTAERADELEAMQRPAMLGAGR